MANEIKCPKCGEVFQVDESGYAAILKQVRDEEFLREVHDRKEQFEQDKEAAVQVTKLELEKYYDNKLKDKENEITKLQSQIVADKIKQENESKELLNEKDKEILSLQNQISEEKIKKETETKELINEKDTEILNLKNQINNFDKDKKLEISEIKAEMNTALVEKENRINKLNSEKELAEKESQIKEQTLKEKYENMLQLKDEEIAQYKDFKAKLSTKMVGESLEQHCEIEFNRLRATAFQNAYFEKDNDAKTGSKGDFIYKEEADGEQFISIMFEMKNESETTASKKKNEDFFKELDKDRNEKNCEYAVLVSMLEPENELYNTGIVDVSYQYPKMYVIRPQFFIPMITLLRNAALNSLEYRKQLSLIKSQNIDISNFEAEMQDFKDKFSNNVRLASANFDKTLAELDKAISHLQKTKDALLATQKQLGNADKKVEDLTIKKLTKNNPTMIAKFAELKTKPKKGK